MSRKNESGQSIVILAIVLVVVLLFAALAIDAGNAYTNRREVQNAVDAAVMAGTRQLVLECSRQGLNPGPSESNIRNQVAGLLQANKLVASEGAPFEAYYTDNNGTRLGANEVGSLGAVPCGCGAGTARGIEVVATGTTQSFFGGLLGNSMLSARAEARAQYGPVANVSSGLYPVTRRMPDPNIPGTEIVINQKVALRILDNADTVPGNFGWLTWAGSPSASVLENSLEPPGDSHTYYNPGTPDNGWTADHSDHDIQVGKWVQGATGNMNSARFQILDHFINGSELMVIPLYDAAMGQGAGANYRVAGFGAFDVTCAHFGGGGNEVGTCDSAVSGGFPSNEKWMEGYFARWVVAGDWAAGVTCDHEGGVYSVRLQP